MPRCSEHQWHSCSMVAVTPYRVRGYSGHEEFVAEQTSYCLRCGKSRMRRLTLDGQWSLWKRPPGMPNGPKGVKVYSFTAHPA